MLQSQTTNECAEDKITHNELRAFKWQTGRSHLHDQHQRPVCPRFDHSFSNRKVHEHCNSKPAGWSDAECKDRAQVDGHHQQTLKNKIPYLTVIAVAAMVLAGCQKPAENETPAPTTPPSAPTNTNSTGSTNLSQANAPAAPGASSINNPVSTNQ